MKELTTSQQKVLEEIKQSIAFAKKFDNFKDYHIAYMSKWCEGRPNYEETYQINKRNFEKNESAIREFYTKYWEMRLNNITLTHCSSATLRVLERKGYIKIVKDTANERYGIDYVELIEG